MGRICRTHVGNEKLVKILVENPQISNYQTYQPRYYQLGKPMRRLENNSKTDVSEIGCVCVDWIQLAHDRVKWRTSMNTLISLLIP